MGQHKENCFFSAPMSLCCSHWVNLFFLFGDFEHLTFPAPPQKWNQWARWPNIQSPPSVFLCYFFLFLPLFFIVFTCTCCWFSAKAISDNHNLSSTLPWVSRTRMTIKPSLLHVLRWLSELTFHPFEDGDGCRSRSKRQCLVFCLTVFGVFSKRIFFRDAGKRAQSNSQACGTLSNLWLSFLNSFRSNAATLPRNLRFGPSPVSGGS